MMYVPRKIELLLVNTAQSGIHHYTSPLGKTTTVSLKQQGAAGAATPFSSRGDRPLFRAGFLHIARHHHAQLRRIDRLAERGIELVQRDGHELLLEGGAPGVRAA